MLKCLFNLILSKYASRFKDKNTKQTNKSLMTLWHFFFSDL